MKNKKTIIIIASILCFLGILITFSLFLFNWNHLEVLDLTPDYIEKRKEIDIENIDNIVLKTMNHNIFIKPSTDEKIHIYYEENKYYTYQITEKNGKLEIKFKDKRNFFQQVIHIFQLGKILIKDEKVKLIVALPKQFQPNLSIDDENGKIDVQNIYVNQFTTQNTNGKINCYQITANKIKIKNINGNISLEKNQAKEIHAKTVNGDISLESAKAEIIQLDSINGDIQGTIVGNEDHFKRKVHTLNGDTNLYNREKGNYELQANNINGNIIIHFEA